MSKILFILVVSYFLQPLTALNSDHRRPKYMQQKSYARVSRIPQLNENDENHNMYTPISDEDYSESDEDKGNVKTFRPLVNRINFQKFDDDENEMCENHETRPKSFKMKKPKKSKNMLYGTKNHDRQKIFIYANLPTPKCECNQTRQQTNAEYPSQPRTTTVHPFYDKYAHIPELKKGKISKQQNLNKEEEEKEKEDENDFINTNNTNAKTLEKEETFVKNIKNKISKSSGISKDSKVRTSKVDKIEQENRNILKNKTQSTTDIFGQSLSNKDIKINKSITESENLENSHENDDMEVEETINYEQVQEPGVLSMRQPTKVQFKPVYLKNYLPIVPITAESDLLKSKHKREKPYKNEMITLNGQGSKNSYQSDKFSNFEEQTTKYSKMNQNRKTSDQFSNYRQRNPSNNKDPFKRNNYSNIDGSSKQSITKYVEIPLNDQSDEYMQQFRQYSINNYNNNNNNDDTIISDDSIESEESKPKAPLSIYLNKIITKRCNEDHEKFPSLSMQDNYIDSNTEDQDSNLGSTQDEMSDRNSNKFNSDEDMNKSEVEVKDDYINYKINMDPNPILCNKNWLKNNGEEIDGDSAKCALRPAFRDLYGYQQHLT